MKSHERIHFMVEKCFTFSFVHFPRRRFRSFICLHRLHRDEKIRLKKSLKTKTEIDLLSTMCLDDSMDQVSRGYSIVTRVADGDGGQAEKIVLTFFSSIISF